jgi:hypothetical protein
MPYIDYLLTMKCSRFTCTLLVSYFFEFLHEFLF